MIQELINRLGSTAPNTIDTDDPYGNGLEWPTPEYDLPDHMYECAWCFKVVVPDQGDKQAGLLIAGSTVKLCESCANDMRHLIES